MWIRNGLKGLVYRLSCVFHFIDRGISTAHCRSPSSDSVDLLSRTMLTSVVVSDWCITNLGHSWWVSILSEEETDTSAVRCASDRLLCCLIVGIHASGISIPLFLLMLLGWSLMWIASLTLREYQWGSRSINFVPEQMMPSLIGVFRNVRSYTFFHSSSQKT